MSQVLTIEGLDEATAAQMTDEAQRRGIQINELVLELVRGRFGAKALAPSGTRYHDLDDGRGDAGLRCRRRGHAVEEHHLGLHELRVGRDDEVPVRDI